MTSPERKPYHGLFRKLVIAFDVGTTFSGASFAILDPNEVPKIQGVTRFPAQAKTGGDCKIPSILYYDQEGSVRAVGAEALDEAFLEQAEDENFIRVEWFKLHLRPRDMSTSGVRDSDLPPIPPNKTPLRIFADFLKYLHDCTIKYIQETGPLYAPGTEFWNSVQGNTEFILSHPNGWEGHQQTLMRRAAVLAGLISEESSQTAIHFVTEGEASLHFCVMNGKVNTLGGSGGLIIVDAGGGTVDLSTYHQSSQDSFEEVARTRCLLQGSVYVSRRARAYMKQKLANSKYSSDEDIDQIVQVFDRTAKLVFRDPENPAFIRFGTAKDRDPSVDIRNGQLKLAGETVEEFFAPSLKETVQAIKEIREESSKPISTILLVGGFAANEWLFSTLQREMSSLGLTVSRPDGHVNKAVTDGALSFYLDHFVAVRVSKYTYGTECSIPFNATDPEHRRRSHLTTLGLSGRRMVPNAFSIILSKGTRVHEEKEFSESYYQDSTSSTSFKTVFVEIMSYRGRSNAPSWVDVDPHMYTTLCTIVADASKAAQFHQSPTRSYYTVNFKIILLLGLTELKAQISWMENGQERRSPATVVFDSEMNAAR